MARARVGCRSAQGSAGEKGWPGLAARGARQASVERYVMGVRPVLINVFVDDLVEILAAARAGRRHPRRVRPSLPSRKPVRERHGAMLSSRRSCH
ncbi:hypothetical protein CFB44_21025 [Burkholderia sp. AU31280]|nr:hypothetical protein CFB44_21025 [Burkholderia sp. AU31280]RQU95854.1 hypothetical protein DF133_02085 [Burkholderia cenocepacia]